LVSGDLEEAHGLAIVGHRFFLVIVSNGLAEVIWISTIPKGFREMKAHVVHV